jgi:hypothetical protein
MRSVALLLTLLLTACGSTPTQPSQQHAQVVHDSGFGIMLCAIGSSSSCSATWRLRNIGAGCAQRVQAVLTVFSSPGGSTIGIYHSDPLPHTDTLRPNQTFDFRLTDVPLANIPPSSYRVDATWIDVPCGS